jgi:hypothetical protein
MTQFGQPLLCALLTFALYAAGPAARADTEGETWLQRIDAAAQVDNAHLILDVTVTDKQGHTAPRTLEIWQKGTAHRLVRLKAPARLTGVGLLVRPGDSLHLFLPAYPPARRIVGSKRSDAFMGTDFAMEDLSQMTWADRYEAVVVGKDDTLTHLKLVPTTDTGDSAVHLWVGPGAEATVRRIEHINKKGVLSRRLTMEEIRPVGGVPMAHRIKVEDLIRIRTTEAAIRTVEVDEGVGDHIFTVTSLEQP